MNRYNIKLYNSEENRWKIETVEAYSFAEAASSAYTLKNSKGFNWKIQSVSLIVEKAE